MDPLSLDVCLFRGLFSYSGVIELGFLVLGRSAPGCMSWLGLVVRGEDG